MTRRTLFAMQKVNNYIMTYDLIYLEMFSKIKVLQLLVATRNIF